jgi:Rrf2 family protein
LSNPIRVSEAANIALHATGLLAAAYGQRPISAAEMAGSLGVSKAHLSKVLQRLMKAGLVRSSRGPGGGYSLAHPPREISLKKIYEAIEGPLRVGGCLLGLPVCKEDSCPLGDLFNRLGAEFAEGLSRTTLADHPLAGCI